MTVDVRAAAIEKAWRAAGQDSLWVLFRTPSHKGGTDAAYEAFEAAVTTANDRAAGRGDDNDVYAEAPAPTPAGFAVLMSRTSDRAALRRFVEDLAALLDASGLSGAITAAGDARTPAWADGGPVLAAFVAWTTDLDAMTRDPQRTSGWHVPDDRTRRITGLVAAWAGPLTDRTIVRAGTHAVELAGPTTTEVADLLARGVRATGMAGLETVDEAARTVRQASLAPGGETVLQVATDHELPWGDVVRLLREALTALPADLDHGFIRPTVRSALSAQMLDAALELPAIREHHVRYNKHLLDRFVPDVHGLQVVTDRHLARLEDTRGWRITPLEGGRHLVEAEDLEPWCAATLPDPAVLDAARAQWASVLLTPDTVAAHPAPWLTG